jgi:peroxiredoxin (alkyl hydroperoxide reductase subunit C)
MNAGTDPATAAPGTVPGPRLPRLNEPAIPFRVRTTHGERSLADYRGRWLLLFSHPADFTPVCTSEFIALAKLHDDFQALGCDLLGLSVDSLFAHLAWVRSIREAFGIEIPFPIAEDVSMAVASAYGMIHAADTSTATVRATFLIDPVGILRSAQEMLRALAALQQADASGLSTPGEWRPGEDGLLPPPLTVAEADARARDGAPAWYYQSRPARP